MVRKIPPYLALIRRFLHGDLAAKAFVGIYLDQWRKDTQREWETIFIKQRTQRQQALDGPALEEIAALHSTASCFTTDTGLLRDARHKGMWVDEDELKRHARKVLAVLEDWESKQ